MTPVIPKAGGKFFSPSSEAYWLVQANSLVQRAGAPLLPISPSGRVVTETTAAGRVWGSGTQEFLTSSLNTSVTPEPETWMLMGTGLMLIVGFAIKRGRLV